MALTLEQVTQMAPDEASLAAGRKLQAARHWQNLGRDEHAFWGECLGSATYQVKFDLAQQGYHCSCPSRKFPCKHVLGLLLLATSSPEQLTASDSPEWVAQWLAKRHEAAAKKQLKQSEAETKPVDEKAQQKRAEQRHERVSEGLAQLDLWMNDLIYVGLAGLEARGAGLWEDQARRLVDAQAPGVASRVRRLGELPGSGPAWPQRLLHELGKIKLAIHAYRRIDQLDELLASDLRQWIGWTISSDEVEKTGEKVTDDWLILGQWIDDDDRLRIQRTWCRGKTSGRMALVLQFAVGTAGFEQQLTPGVKQSGVMTYYPGMSRQRAQFKAAQPASSIVQQDIAWLASFEAFLQEVAVDLARQPWLSAFGCLIQGVTFATTEHGWWLRDQAGQLLRLAEFDAWRLLALSGGHPFALAGEWDGNRLRPLGALVEGVYRLL